MTQNALDAIESGIDRANRGFENAFNKGQPGAAARGVYTRDARILPPGAEMIQGREAIAAYWEAGFTAGLRRVELQTLDLQPLGDSVSEVGRATLTMADGAQVTAKFVVIWRQEEGTWRWHVDIWNMNP